MSTTSAGNHFAAAPWPTTLEVASTVGTVVLAIGRRTVVVAPDDADATAGFPGRLHPAAARGSPRSGGDGGATC